MRSSVSSTASRPIEIDFLLADRGFYNERILRRSRDIAATVVPIQKNGKRMKRKLDTHCSYMTTYRMCKDCKREFQFPLAVFVHPISRHVRTVLARTDNSHESELFGPNGREFLAELSLSEVDRTIVEAHLSVIDEGGFGGHARRRFICEARHPPARRWFRCHFSAARVY